MQLESRVAEWGTRPDAVLSLADDPLPLAIAGAVVVLVAGIAVGRRRGTETAEGDDGAGPIPGGDGRETTAREESDGATFEDRIGEATLERLAPIAPDAVERVRELVAEGRVADREGLDRAERELRRGLEEALADGRLDVGVTGPDGRAYEIVNLPSRYRELSLPPTGETVHVDAAERAVRDRLEDGSIREAAMAAAAVDDHREAVRRHVRDREEAIVDRRREIEATLSDVRELVDRLEGALADRVAEFVLEGRHDDVVGVSEIERRISDATRQLYRCSFDDARRALRDADEAADELLVTVDFLGGLVGTIEHGSGRVAIPAGVSTALMTDLEPIVERQYDVDATIDGDAFVVADRGPTGERPSPTDGVGEPADATAVGEPDDGSTAVTESRSAVAPEAVADEILFVLRELDGSPDGATVQCQTERLPDGVARAAVLEELAAFCRRQTDLVQGVDLQEGAPPGFLEIEFAGRTTPRDGLDALQERFVERHGD
ncbi:hypothetical protein A6E15_17120 [Natrinema saccharevitans]|uniref:Coiled-coil protein n=1 Tax=Natrinema saccharevitans TaxID=301967 RepID=A0A1S8B153_9EURY|nr:hypothetical protein [Natrinema saccharevitans]OLZ42576.1 hypothetical protein A6E15_17120 [Natrinema saccharevitans]